LVATIVGMKSSDLPPEKIARFRDEIARQLRYHNRVCARMQCLGWPLDDPIVMEGMRVRDALQDLYTATHYVVCAIGVRQRADDSKGLTPAVATLQTKSSDYFLVAQPAP
jgi:hypothetical protein